MRSLGSKKIQTVPEDCYIWVFPSCVRAFYPNQIALQNIQPELIPQCQFAPIFMRGKFIASRHCSLLEDAEVGAVDGHQTVIPTSALLPAVEVNLKKKQQQIR